MLLYMYHYILKINSRESDFKNVTTNPIQVSFLNSGNSSLIEKITVKGASIPNVFYNITSKNNKLSFNGNFFNNIVFPEGNYTINSLINFFNQTAQAIAESVSFSFDSFLNKILVTVINPITFIHVSSTIFNVLGLKTDQDFIAIAPNIHFPFMSDLSGIRNIYAETSFSNMNCLDSTGYKSYGAFIPVDKPFSSIIHYINQEQDLDSIIRSKVYSQNLNKIQIVLRDVDGNILNLQNMNWEITFKIFLSHEHDLIEN